MEIISFNLDALLRVFPPIDPATAVMTCDYEEVRSCETIFISLNIARNIIYPETWISSTIESIQKIFSTVNYLNVTKKNTRGKIAEVKLSSLCVLAFC